MTQKITPFLWFDNKAEEAMNFYVSIFKDGKILKIQRYPEGPLENPIKGMEGKVLTGVFEIFGQRFMAIDGGPLFRPNESVSFLVECSDQAEIDYYWEALTANGGEESQCGWLKDKYGFSWQITPNMEDFMNMSKDPVKFDRAMKAILKMKKIDMAELQRAYDGN